MASEFFKQLEERTGYTFEQRWYEPHTVIIFVDKKAICCIEDLPKFAGELLVVHEKNYEEMLDSVVDYINSQISSVKVD